MVNIYSYDAAKEVSKLFKENKIVTLKIYFDATLSEYVFDYRTIEDYSEEQRVQIRNSYSMCSLTLVQSAGMSLGEFIKMREADNIVFFEYTYDYTLAVFNIQKQFKENVAEVVGDNEYQNLLTSIEKLLSDNKLLTVKVPGVYERNASSNKQQKQSAMTFEQLLTKLKEVTLNGSI